MLMSRKPQKKGGRAYCWPALISSPHCSPARHHSPCHPPIIIVVVVVVVVIALSLEVEVVVVVMIVVVVAVIVARLWWWWWMWLWGVDRIKCGNSFHLIWVTWPDLSAMGT